MARRILFALCSLLALAAVAASAGDEDVREQSSAPSLTSQSEPANPARGIHSQSSAAEPSASIHSQPFDDHAVVIAPQLGVEPAHRAPSRPLRRAHSVRAAMSRRSIATSIRTPSPMIPSRTSA
jgi:hypothetical protein